MQTGEILGASLEQIQLEIGTGSPVIESSFVLYGHLATYGWTNLWEFVSNKKTQSFPLCSVKVTNMSWNTLLPILNGPRLTFESSTNAKSKCKLLQWWISFMVKESHSWTG
jgi:hypothetical protein